MFPALNNAAQAQNVKNQEDQGHWAYNWSSIRGAVMLVTNMLQTQERKWDNDLVLRTWPDKKGSRLLYITDL